MRNRCCLAAIISWYKYDNSTVVSVLLLIDKVQQFMSNYHYIQRSLYLNITISILSLQNVTNQPAWTTNATFTHT